MGGKSCGIRKRRFLRAVLNDPTPQQWLEGQSRAGPSGGCDATLIRYIEAGESYDPSGTIYASRQGPVTPAERNTINERFTADGFTEWLKRDGKFYYGLMEDQLTYM